MAGKSSTAKKTLSVSAVTAGKAVSIQQTAVTKSLHALLSESYALMLLTHHYHWNVEGPHFISLHTLFEQQYTELFAAVDIIAERIRALGAPAFPEGYGAMLQSASVAGDGKSAGKGLTGAEAARAMVKHLIKAHEAVISAAKKARKAAENAGDDESVDLTVQRVTLHQKNVWMLKSILA
ncbi:MAG: DNA starvation/stationary phase protection protein [Alphaproteobacteria bacterium]|nr:DNA starvation/stationary phase protection protein [Alphaproteobacteria bacterium]